MPLCSGKVTVPSGCSTALVMNRRPGHAPQLLLAADTPMLAADALAGAATAMRARRPSTIVRNLVLRNLATGSSFLLSACGLGKNYFIWSPFAPAEAGG